MNADLHVPKKALLVSTYSCKLEHIRKSNIHFILTILISLFHAIGLTNLI